MIKCLALLSVVAFCTAEDYYQLSIDHNPKGDYKMASESKTPSADLKGESSAYGREYKSEEIDRRGYSMPSSYGYEKKREEYDSESSYSAPYGYERPKYQKQQSYERQSYERPSYSKSYDPEPHYVEKSYSSPVSAMRSVQIKPIQSEDYGQKDHTIDVRDDTPIVIHFRTHANRIKVEQTRVPDKPKEVEHTRSEDEPHRVVHEVYKPVIQEIREIIQPFRKVVQQVQPVVEEVQTVVHKSDGRRGRGGDDGGGDGYGQRQYSRDQGYKRSTNGGQGKKYATMKDYLPQGSVLSVRGIPVYRSQYRGPAVPQKKY